MRTPLIMFEPIGNAAKRVVYSVTPRRLASIARGRMAKAHVRAAIKLGAGHPSIRARYGRRAAMLQHYDIDAACWLVRKWLREEKRALEVASVFGRGTELSVQILTDIRLILRMLRRSKYRDHFQGVIGFVVGSHQEAAE